MMSKIRIACYKFVNNQCPFNVFIMNSFVRITSSLSLLKDENILLFQSKKEMKTVKLEPLLSQLLYELVILKNQVISKEDLIEDVWNGNGYVGNDALRKNIYKLRSLINKVDLFDEITIVTIPKKGYKLVISEKISRKKIVKLSKKINYSIVASILVFFFVGLMSVEEIEINNTSDTLFHASSKRNIEIEEKATISFIKKSKTIEEEEEIVLIDEN